MLLLFGCCRWSCFTINLFVDCKHYTVYTVYPTEGNVHVDYTCIQMRKEDGSTRYGRLTTIKTRHRAKVHVHSNQGWSTQEHPSRDVGLTRLGHMYSYHIHVCDELDSRDTFNNSTPEPCRKQVFGNPLTLYGSSTLSQLAAQTSYMLYLWCWSWSVTLCDIKTRPIATGQGDLPCTDKHIIHVHVHAFLVGPGACMTTAQESLL